MNGDGDIPLVLAPGWMCDAEIFAPQIEALGLHGAMIAENRLDDSLGAMAERLLASAPERFAIAGFSMGGMLAAELMDRAPERLLGAAMISSEAEAAPEKEHAFRAHLEAEMSENAEGGGAAALEKRLDWMMGRFSGHEPGLGARLGPRYRTMAERFDRDCFLCQSKAIGARRDLLQAVGAFAASGKPLLVIAGLEDKLCPPARQRALKTAAPAASLIFIEACGHLASWERSEIVSAALKGWLSEI